MTASQRLQTKVLEAQLIGHPCISTIDQESYWHCSKEPQTIEGCRKFWNARRVEDIHYPHNYKIITSFEAIKSYWLWRTGLNVYYSFDD
jgi:hypothetical protein